MNIIEFIVDGKVVGKARPRFARMGNFVRTYSSQQDISYENWVKNCFVNAVNDDFKPYENQIRVVIVAYFGIPKSASRKQKENMLLELVRPTKKPDCDNIAKSICDALNKIAYHDDSQIVELLVYKLYGEQEYCKITIEEL